jgi:hypothetical protein
MFEEHIAQCKDMIRRLDAEKILPAYEREALPGHKRVPISEAVAWQRAIEQKISSNFNKDTVARFSSISEMFREEVDKGLDDEYSRALNLCHRIVNLLEELEDRVQSTTDD